MESVLEKNKNILDIINQNLQTTYREAGRVLVHYKVAYYFIGDSLVRISYLKLIRKYFKNAHITIHFENKIDGAMLQNNPYINSLVTGGLDFLSLEDYDVIILIGDEHGFLQFLDNNYATKICEGKFKGAILSFAGFLDKFEQETKIFKPFDELKDYIEIPENYQSMEKEIFISNKDMVFADSWFHDMGLGTKEKVIVLVDSSSSDEKLLPLEVYFELVTYFLGFENTKILIFDENGINKSLFYISWLGDEYKNRFLFFENGNFRHALALISSPRVKFIFGPCTGLMHCASAIYTKERKRDDLRRGKIPIILVYASYDPDEDEHKSQWWWDNEVAKCVVITANDNPTKKIVFIKPSIDEYLPCRHFTAELLQKFIHENFGSQMNAIGLSLQTTNI